MASANLLNAANLISTANLLNAANLLSSANLLSGAAAPAAPFDKTSLVGWWDLEANGNDSHTGGKTLTAVNTPTFAAGKIGNAASFVAVSAQYFSRNDETDFDITAALTIGAWVNFTSLANNRGILAKYLGTGEQRSYQIAVNSAGAAQFILSTDGTSGTVKTAASANGAITTSAWYFIVGVFNASTIQKIYVNGVEAGTQASPPAAIFSSSANFWIGAQFGITPENNMMNGLVDSAFVFSRALTPDEITYLYNAGAGRSYSQL